MRRLLLVLVCGLVFGGLWLPTVQGTGGQGSGPAWANPGATTLRLVGPAPDAPEQPNFQSNLDCGRMTYRLTTSDTMQTGCFVATAYGLVDPDSDLVVFTGTDEALPLLPYFAHQVLTPWPGTVDTLSLSTAITGGSYVSLYKNLVGQLQDVRDPMGRLTGKQLAGPPDIQLTDPAGQPLIINAQTVAFSENGDWLVAETLGSSFVRINLATLEVTPFAQSFGSLGSPGLLSSQVAVTDDGRYIAIENNLATSFKVYDLSSCSGAIAGLHPLSCATHEYWPFVNGQLTGLRGLTHLRFINDGLLGFYGTDNSGVRNYELAPAAGITALIDYLALGDSYTSGEGAFDYRAGTDTGTNVCHLSQRSYPLLISEQLFSSGHSVACSGTVLHDVWPDQPASYPGQVSGGIARDRRASDDVAQILADFSPGYLSQAEFVNYYQPGIITVSVGGDDIGFGDIIQNCVEPHISLHLSDSTCYDTYEDRLEIKQLIDHTVPKWATLYKKLKSKSPGSTVFAIGYPQIAVDTGDCALNVHLSKSELEFSEELVDYINGAVQRASGQAGVQYIDIGQALNGHRLCETAGYAVAVNGLTAGSDGGIFGLKIFGKESYHPNALGQSLIAAYILKQSHDFADANTGTGSNSDDGQKLLNAPKSGRPVSVLIPGHMLASGIINRGSSTPIQLDASAGLRPGGTYTIRLDGSSGTVVGQEVARSDSSLSSSFNVPPNISPGGHTVDVIGSNQVGEAVDVTQPVYIAAAEGDSDGDGTTDASDSCPGASNSGQDSDHDGIDDTCDPLISPANSSFPTGNLQVLDPTNSDLVYSAIPEPALAITSSFTGPAKLTPAADKHPGVLGTAIVHHIVNVAGAKPTVHATSEKWASLPRINWLPWAGLTVVLPLLLLLIIWLLDRTLRKSDQQSCSVLRQPPGTAVKIITASCTIVNMNLVRKGIVHLLSLVLMVSLIGGAAAVSVDIAFGQPAKVEAWLDQSNIYSSFVNNAIKQANTSANGGGQGGGISLNDVAVQQAANSAFSPALLRQDVNSVINSNYDWLEGKTATPDFKVDLSAAKTSFAQQVGQYVEARLASLPVCTTAQLPLAEQQLNSDPLSLTCRPAPLSPATEGASVTQQLSNSGDFLGNPVITADTISPNGNNNSNQPYYKKLSAAPRLYRLATSAPLVLGALAVLTAAGVLFIAPSKRRGLRRIAWVLLEAGILLTIMKFATDFAFKKAEDQIFNKASVGALQQSLTDFAHRAESQLVSVNLYAGIAFLVLAVAIFTYLIISHGRQPRAGTKTPAPGPKKPDASPDTSSSPAAGQPTAPSNNDPVSQSATEAPKPKRPRLIQ